MKLERTNVYALKSTRYTQYCTYLYYIYQCIYQTCKLIKGAIVLQIGHKSYMLQNGIMYIEYNC